LQEEEGGDAANKLAPEILNRLLWRPEDQPANAEENIRKYNANALWQVEVNEFVKTLYSVY
jgi:hypothetical protein